MDEHESNRANTPSNDPDAMALSPGGKPDEPKGKGEGGDARATDYEIAQLQLQIVELRMAGYSFDQISAHVGRAKSTCHKHYRRAIKAVQEETLEQADQLRAMGMRRIERMISRVWNKAMPAQERGPDGKLKPGDVDIDAMNTLARLLDQHAKLGGYNSPQKTEISMEILQLTITKVIDIVDQYVPDDRVPDLIRAIEEQVGGVMSNAGGMFGMAMMSSVAQSAGQLEGASDDDD